MPRHRGCRCILPFRLWRTDGNVRGSSMQSMVWNQRRQSLERLVYQWRNDTKMARSGMRKKRSDQIHILLSESKFRPRAIKAQRREQEVPIISSDWTQLRDPQRMQCRFCIYDARLLDVGRKGLIA